MNTITLRTARAEDLDDWIEVARSVKHVFRSPTMDSDPEFLDYAARKIAQQDAVCACAAGRCVGFVGFSRHFNRITWVGVAEGWQGRGVGARLLRETLSRLNESRPITVDTFRNDYALGQPARKLYAKFGFEETRADLHDSLGNEIAQLTRIPSRT